MRICDCCGNEIKDSSKPASLTQSDGHKIDLCQECIDLFPIRVPKPVIIKRVTGYDNMGTCPHCGGYVWDYNDDKFCTRCGARIDGWEPKPEPEPWPEPEDKETDND